MELVINILNSLNNVVIDNGVDDSKMVLEAMSAIQTILIFWKSF